MELLIFLSSVLAISLTGALAPGPVTAVALNLSVRNRFAGSLIAIGHGIVELPLIILITLGLGVIFRRDISQILIGLCGGGMLIFMGVGFIRGIKKVGEQEQSEIKDRPIWAGIVLTAGNPYFLVWWATIGLKLTLEAKSFGVWGFVIFAFVHWMCDLVWLTILSVAGHKGSSVYGDKSEKAVLSVCSVVMFFFGGTFMADAVIRIISMAYNI